MKVKINKLPEGYKIKKGKIVKVMATGGAPYNNSLSAVPRKFANLEAEKGETALTDLTQDGNFELYNIGGRRHQDGGTDLSLPEQSFIFSDTAKMKLNKAQLQTFGINSKKKMSPAAVSKKFPLNRYYSAINGEFSDDITDRSANLMLDKNKMKLSQLAFVSESKKKFEDGVPLAAYPYLMSKDIDPMEFVQKVNKLNEEQAQMQMIDQLPPEEQQQILALQDFTGGQGGPPQGGMPPMGPPMAGGMPPMPPQGGGMPPQGMMPPQQMMAKYGMERYQEKGSYDENTGIFGKPAEEPIYARYGGGLPKAQIQEEILSIPPIQPQPIPIYSKTSGLDISTPEGRVRDIDYTGAEWMKNWQIANGYGSQFDTFNVPPGDVFLQQGGPSVAPQPQGGQGGGGEMEQIMQMVGQAMEQGAQPEEVIAELLQNQIPPEVIMKVFGQLGMPPEQVEQMIMVVMQQVQGGQQQMAAPQGPPPGPPQGGMPPEMMAAMQQGQGQPQMRYGGGLPKAQFNLPGFLKGISGLNMGNKAMKTNQFLKAATTQNEIIPFSAWEYALGMKGSKNPKDRLKTLKENNSFQFRQLNRKADWVNKWMDWDLYNNALKNPQNYNKAIAKDLLELGKDAIINKDVRLVKDAFQIEQAIKQQIDKLHSWGVNYEDIMYSNKLPWNNKFRDPDDEWEYKYGGGLPQFQGNTRSNEVSTTGNSFWNQLTRQKNKHKGNVNESVIYNEQWDNPMDANEAKELYDWQMSLAVGDSIPPGGVQNDVLDVAMTNQAMSNTPNVNSVNRNYRDNKNDNLSWMDWLYDFVPGVNMGTTSHYQYGGGLPKAQSQVPDNLQPSLHLPSQRLQEVSDMVPFNPADFASKYPQVSYGRDINEGINQGSLVGLAEQLLTAQNATPDGMYDGRYKADPQADYAQKGGMIGAGTYNSPSPHFSLDNRIPAGLYNQPLNKFVYGGEEYIDRYTDDIESIDLPKAQYGQENYNTMMNLYNSDDWDVVNDFGYKSYKKMFDAGTYDMGTEMSQEQYEAQFLADQKFKYLVHNEGALDDITITLPNGDTVSGADIMTHGAWDNPDNKGGFPTGESNGMYGMVYNAFSEQFPDFGLPALPEDLMGDVRQKQSVWQSMGGLKKHAEKMSAEGDDSWSNLLSNVNLEAFGNTDEGGLGEENYSLIDGKYGDTYNSQLVTLTNEPGDEVERPKSTCMKDQNGQPIPSMVAAQKECTDGGGSWDTNVCRCIEKTETGEIKPPPPKEFWKQDLMKMDALGMTDINKYYPSRQSFTGNFMDPAYKDPTREIAAIGEQAQIAGDLAVSMTSGPGLAAVLSKIQGTAGEQVANTLNQIQSENITYYNTKEQFNAGVQTNTDVLNQDAGKTYMDAVNLVDQNYDNANNALRVEMADLHANALTNRANTFNMNTMTDKYNVDPSDGGSIYYTNPADMYANRSGNEPGSDMETRLGLLDDCLAKCQGPTSTPEAQTACMENCQKMVENSMKTNNNNSNTNTNVPPGYPGNEAGNTFTNTEIEPVEVNSQYGSELRRELQRRRRGGQW